MSRPTETSRYRTSRTLVRAICRLPSEDRAEFRGKVARLRGHFERFNTDVSDLCQWIMGLRKTLGDRARPESFGLLGDFLLEPALDGADADESERDRRRLDIFDAVAGLREDRDLRFGSRGVPPGLLDAVRAAAASPRTRSAERLFERLRGLDPAHRMILLKAAAEWVVARYRRGAENARRQREEWEKEKLAWEDGHPALTEQLRGRFTGIYKNLRNPERDGRPGVTRRNPRLCPWDRLSKNIDNCIYAGEKGHGPLCWKYQQFIKDQKRSSNDRFKQKRFAEDASRFIAFCRENKVRNPSNALQSPKLPDRLFAGMDDRKRADLFRLFKTNWNAYLKAMNLSGETLLEKGELPHCTSIGETWEKSACRFNPHTELCLDYKRALRAAVDRGDLAEQDLEQEKDYRAWRARFLAPPRLPTFRYPSARELPIPKIFGAGFHEIDFDRSVLRLRLDDMKPGEWIEFGFRPWPRTYKPSRREVKVTSVHVTFIGVRPRAGFRFEVPHAESRFGCTQDELDTLRSREFPRRAQDQEFLDAARRRLLESWKGGRPKDSIRLLAVDLGETGASAAVYKGITHETDEALPIIKIERAYDALPAGPKADEAGKAKKPTKAKPGDRGEDEEKADHRGVRKEHVKLHLDRIGEGAAEIAAHRAGRTGDQAAAGPAPAPATLAAHDFRGLKRHVRWMIRDWVRHNASRVITVAEARQCDLIVFESLRGFRPPGYEQIDPDKKLRLAMFAFGHIRRKVTEKAVERGMRVVTVPYFKSSQFCSACGHEQADSGRLRRNKKNHKFICECGERKTVRDAAPGAGPARPSCPCRADLNSDTNAARVLARVFWGEIRLPPHSDDAPPGAG